MVSALIGFLFSFLLIFLRVPIGIALGITGFIGFGYIVGWNQASVMVAIVVRDNTMNYTMAVVPLFILMGNLVAGTGISAELYRAAQAFLGGRRGGLAYATVLASGGFASICGSSVAAVVTMGKVAMPSMRQYRYSDELSTSVIAASATLGIIIPPSILLLIYGVVTETHIGKLYAAGLIPGLIGILLYLAAVKWIVARRPELAPAAERAGWAERRASLGSIWPTVLLFVLVIGGIYAGFFTPTEAAGFGAFFAFLIALLRGRLTFETLRAILVDTARTSCVLFILVIGAIIFSEFLNVTGSHEGLLRLIRDNGLSPFAVISIICVVYILLGAIMEELSMVLLTLPLFFPVVISLGYDPVWFGVLVIILCEIGMIAPPLGVNLFVMRSLVPDVDLLTMFKGIIPFICAILIRVFIVILFPSIVIFLPDLLFN